MSCYFLLDEDRPFGSSLEVYRFDSPDQKWTDDPAVQNIHEKFDIDRSAAHYLLYTFRELKEDEHAVVKVKSITTTKRQIVILTLDNVSLLLFRLQRRYDKLNKWVKYKDEIPVHDLSGEFRASSPVVLTRVPENKDVVPDGTWLLLQIPALHYAALNFAGLLKSLERLSALQNNSGITNEYAPDYRNNGRVLFYNYRFANKLYVAIESLLKSTDIENIRPSGFGTEGVWIPTSVNYLFRYNSYQPGQFFEKHQDVGYCANNDLRSILSFVLYLNDDFTGGETRFFHNDGSAAVTVTPKAGQIVVFNHCLWHQALPVLSGTKHVIRGDIMFCRIGKWTAEQNQGIQANPKFHYVRHLYEQTVLAAQKREAELSTQLFQLAQQELNNGREKINFRQELTNAGQVFGSLATSLLFKCFDYISGKELVGECGMPRWSRWFYRRSMNQELWHGLCNAAFTSQNTRVELHLLQKVYAASTMFNFRELFIAKTQQQDQHHTDEKQAAAAAQSKGGLYFIDVGLTGARVYAAADDANAASTPDSSLDICLGFFPNAASVEPIDQWGGWGHRIEQEYELNVLPYMLFAPYGWENVAPVLSLQSSEIELFNGINTWINGIDRGKNQVLFTVSPYISSQIGQSVAGNSPSLARFVPTALLVLFSKGYLSGLVVDAGLHAISLSQVLDLQVDSTTFVKYSIEKAEDTVEYTPPTLDTMSPNTTLYLKECRGMIPKKSKTTTTTTTTTTSSSGQQQQEPPSLTQGVNLDWNEEEDDTRRRSSSSNSRTQPAGYCFNANCERCKFVHPLHWSPFEFKVDTTYCLQQVSQYFRDAPDGTIVMVVGGRASWLLQHLTIPDRLNFIALSVEEQRGLAARDGAKLYNKSIFA